MSKRRGSFIGGSTLVTVTQSDKRMADRKAHWQRKLGHDQIEQVRGVADDSPPRLIKRDEELK